MYASNQTTNYDLSQWLPTDPVHHEDFNGDNAKLDAALAAKADAAETAELADAVDGLAAAVGEHASNNFEGVTVAWGEHSVSWYADSANAMMNESGVKYHVIVLMDCNGE